MTAIRKPRLLDARREMVGLARRTSWSEVSDRFGIDLLTLLDWAVEVDRADGIDARQTIHAAQERLR